MKAVGIVQDAFDGSYDNVKKEHKEQYLVVVVEIGPDAFRGALGFNVPKDQLGNYKSGDKVEFVIRSFKFDRSGVVLVDGTVKLLK